MSFYIEHRIGIAAPPEVVWAILSNIEGWSELSPIYRQASGTLRIGAAVTVERALGAEAPETVNYSVLDWAPDMQIHLQSKLYGGLFSTTRYMEIEKLTDQGCLFGNGEIFRGPLSRFVPRALKAALRQGFVTMSETLKQRAEAAWLAQQAPSA